MKYVVRQIKESEKFSSTPYWIQDMRSGLNMREDSKEAARFVDKESAEHVATILCRYDFLMEQLRGTDLFVKCRQQFPHKSQV